MPLIHGRTSSWLRPIISPISAWRDSLACLPQLRITPTAAVDAEEQSKQNKRAASDTNTDHELLVLANPAKSRGAFALPRAAAAARVAGCAIEVVLVHANASRCSIRVCDGGCTADQC